MSVDRPRPLVAGNWKMNGFAPLGRGLCARSRPAIRPALRAKVDLLVCPPATLCTPSRAGAVGTRIAIGGQDCHAEASGRLHGRPLRRDAGRCRRDRTSSSAIRSAGNTMARRTRTCAPRRSAAHRAGLTAIVCVGETREEREAGKTLAVVRRQLKGSVPAERGGQNLVVAYEPVWAIGTGLTPTAADVAEVHALIRDELRRLVGKPRARPGPDPLRRLGQAVERGGTAGGRERRRRAGRRREPRGRGFPRHRGRLSRLRRAARARRLASL